MFGCQFGVNGQDVGRNVDVTDVIGRALPGFLSTAIATRPGTTARSAHAFGVDKLAAALVRMRFLLPHFPLAHAVLN